MSDEVSIGELVRTMEAFRRDVREDFQQLMIRMDQMVPREVYAADRVAYELRIERLESQAEDARKAAQTADAANKQAVKNAKVTVITTVIAGVILAFFGVWLNTGGHG